MPCGKRSGKAQVQKVVIPKGMINPGETTIIEIPSNLQRQPIVVAKRKSQSEMDDQRYATALTGGRSAPPSVASGAGSRDVYPSQHSYQSEQRNYGQNTSMDKKAQMKKNKNNGPCDSYAECGLGGSYGLRQQSAADLDKTERCEREQFLHDLEEFQKARRKLLANASFMANKDFS